MASVLAGYVAGYRAAADALRARIRELRVREYPTALSKALLATIDAALERSLEAVEELSQTESDATEIAVLRHGHLLTFLHHYVHLVGSSMGGDVPRWAIDPMKAEIRRYIKKDEVDVLIVGAHEGGNFAYDYGLDRLQPMLVRAFGEDTASELTRDLPAHMAVFHFPFGERDNVVAHGAFFHEVGHQIDIAILGTSRRVTEQFLIEKGENIRSTVRTIVEPILEQTFPGASEDPVERTGDINLLVDTTLPVIQGVLYNWAREFCADLIATRILGPAYALVIVTSPALQSSVRQHAESHPATLLRLKLVLDLLASKVAGDFFGECEQALSHAGIATLLSEWRVRCDEDATPFNWTPALHMLPRAEVQSYTASLGTALGRTLLDVIIKETTAQDYYTPAEYAEAIEVDLPMLERDFTINERLNVSERTSTVNEIAAIYNVGIASYLRRSDSSGRARVAKLVRKSIELSQIQRALTKS